MERTSPLERQGHRCLWVVLLAWCMEGTTGQRSAGGFSFSSVWPNASSGCFFGDRGFQYSCFPGATECHWVHEGVTACLDDMSESREQTQALARGQDSERTTMATVPAGVTCQFCFEQTTVSAGSTDVGQRPCCSSRKQQSCGLSGTGACEGSGRAARCCQSL